MKAGYTVPLLIAAISELLTVFLTSVREVQNKYDESLKGIAIPYTSKKAPIQEVSRHLSLIARDCDGVDIRVICDSHNRQIKIFPSNSNSFYTFLEAVHEEVEEERKLAGLVKLSDEPGLTKTGLGYGLN